MNLKQYINIYDEFYNKCYKTLDENLFMYMDVCEEDKICITKMLIDLIQEDISALINGDPAAKQGIDSAQDGINSNSIEYVLNSYKSLEAVIMYRIAHFIYSRYSTEYLSDKDFSPEEINDVNYILQTQARKLSEQTKVNTGIEIHPAAKIGKGFVIDHGYGTVIGETCEIGNGCYILQGVTLGSRGIKNNVNERRHPKLEDNVEIAGFARIFGKVTIGSGSKICGHAVVDRNIPPNSVVSIVNQIQIVSPNNHLIVIYGVCPNDESIEIFGRNLNRCKDVKLLDKEGKLISSVEITLTQSNKSLLLSFKGIENILFSKDIKKYIISLNIDNESVLIENSIGWCDFIDNLKNKFNYE